jgi:hypothetical protein
VLRATDPLAELAPPHEQPYAFPRYAPRVIASGERDAEETRDAGLRFSISMSIAAIILTIAIVVGLASRHHSGARLKHPAAALQQTDPVSGR